MWDMFLFSWPETDKELFLLILRLTLIFITYFFFCQIAGNKSIKRLAIINMHLQAHLKTQTGPIN